MSFKLLPGETFKPLKFSFKGSLLRNQYAISNKGRIVSFREKTEDGKLLKGTLVQGYRVFKAKPDGQNVTLFIHKIVAETFTKKPGRKAEFVIHLDHDKLNNKAENLKWVTREELNEHLKNSPKLKAYYNRGDAAKRKAAKEKARPTPKAPAKSKSGSKVLTGKAKAGAKAKAAPKKAAPKTAVVKKAAPAAKKKAVAKAAPAKKTTAPKKATPKAAKGKDKKKKK